MTHDTQATRLADEAKRLKELARTCRAWDGPHNWSVFDAAVDDALRDPAIPVDPPFTCQGDWSCVNCYLGKRPCLAIPAGEAVAWLYHDADSLAALLTDERDGYGMMYSVLLSLKRQPIARNETPLYASPQPTPEAREADTAAFKNFHRSLCKRFGYHHDEIDWRRDQVSLEEFIAAKAAAPSVLAMREALQAMVDCSHTMDIPTCARASQLAAAALASTLPEPQEGELLCKCKDRPASQCDEEWGPKCSLGTGAEHAVRVSDERAAEIDAALGISLRVLAGNCHRFINVGDLKAAHFAINRLRLAAEAGIATPKPQERKPLTDAEIDEVREDFRLPREYRYFARAVEARAHGIVPQDGDRGEGEMAE